MLCGVVQAKARFGQAAAALLLALPLTLTGCADWSRETRIEEATYQVLSAVDTAQTFQAARHPECYGEGDPITSVVIGQHPKPGAVLGYGIARAGLHAFVTDWMVRDDASPTALRIWQALTLGIEGRDVRNNWVIGLRFSSATPPAYAPCRRPGP